MSFMKVSYSRGRDRDKIEKSRRESSILESSTNKAYKDMRKNERYSKNDDGSISKDKVRRHYSNPSKSRSMFRFKIFGLMRALLNLLFKITRFCFQNSAFWWIAFLTISGSLAFFARDAFIASTKSYFSLKKIKFDGNEKVPEILLLKVSKLHYKKSSLETPIKEVKERLEKLSWVKAAVVQRKLPGQISTRISERTPVAILQSQNKLHLVDSDGVILDNDGMGNYNNLPIVAGKGAETEFFSFLQTLEKFPKIRRQLVFAVRVGQRRWNIRINRGITVKLPEKGLMQAFGILDEISDSKGFFNEGIKSLDLRVPDRIVISTEK